MNLLKTTLLSSILLQSFVFAGEFGTFNGDFKSFYFSGNRDNRQDREAFAVGGILKYTTPSIKNLSASVAFFSSHDLLQRGNGNTLRINNTQVVNDTSNIAGNSDLVLPNGSSINILGEAYIKYSIENTTLKIGRQRLNTPLVNDYYNRFLPNSFQAIYLQNKDIQNTTLTACAIKRWKYKAKDEFIDISNGLDETLYLIGVQNGSITDLNIQGWLSKLNNAFDTLYATSEYKNILLSSQWNFSTAFQFLKQNNSGSAKLGVLNTYLLGAKLALYNKYLKFEAMMDKVGNDTIHGSGDDYTDMGWSKFITFTDIQIGGETLNAGALSYGAIIQYSSDMNYNIALKYVHINQDDTKQLTSVTPNKRPSSDEYNLDMSYKSNNLGKIRLRVAKIDYATNPLITNEYDELNIRLIYDYLFNL